MKTYVLSTVAVSCLVGVTIGLTLATGVAEEPVIKETAPRLKAQRKINLENEMRARPKRAPQKHQATTMTAIAMAEAGGNTQKTPGPVLRAKGKAPTRTDLRPWNGTNSRYLEQHPTGELGASRSISPPAKPAQARKSELKKRKPVR